MQLLYDPWSKIMAFAARLLSICFLMAPALPGVMQVLSWYIFRRSSKEGFFQGEESYA